MDEKGLKVLDSLQNLCSKKECCSSEVFRKAFQRLEGDRKAAEEVVAALVKDSFVDDRRYAAAFAREKSALTGWGTIKIRQALLAKGISRSDIDEALPEIDSERAASRLRKLLEAKWKLLEGDPYSRFKLLKYALSRGYEYSEVEDLVAEITSTR